MIFQSVCSSFFQYAKVKSQAYPDFLRDLFKPFSARDDAASVDVQGAIAFASAAYEALNHFATTSSKWNEPFNQVEAAAKLVTLCRDFRDGIRKLHNARDCIHMMKGKGQAAVAAAKKNLARA